MSEEQVTLDDLDEVADEAGSSTNGWQQIEMGELAEYQNGNAFSKSEWTDDGYPIIRIQNLTGEQEEFNYFDGELEDRYRVKNGDLLLSWSATIDVFEWNGPEAALNQHIYRVDTTDQVNEIFFRFKLEELLPRLEALSHGSTMKHVRKADLVNLNADIPPLEEQRKIASVLYTVDQAIQKTDEIIQQTERLHTALRRELVIAGIDHDEFQEMRVGPFTFEIPASWDIVHVDEACENLDKDRIPVKEAKREEMQGDIPYYGASGVIDYVDDHLFDDELILLAEDGENLLSRNLPIAFKISGKTWVNNHAHVLRPRQEFDIDYLVEYFERLNYEPFVTGSAQPKLTQTNMEMLSVPKPPEEEQAEISSVLTSVSVRKNRSEKYKEKLQRLKQGLMQDLLSGEIRTHDKDIEPVDEVLQHG